MIDEYEWLAHLMRDNRSMKLVRALDKILPWRDEILPPRAIFGEY